MSVVQKRLHVSGLTPAITANDISARLHSFGKVVALDGFGMMNAVGEPRKFAYVTLETTEFNLARCLNLLSGTTWKGTKLRIGDAKPDYAQRLEIERKRAADGELERLNKRKRLPRGVNGVHAEDMSVVDFENVDLHPGWHKTTLSHLICPMKMRPSHPLPELAVRKAVGIQKKMRRKNRTSDIPTRARVQAIDPRLYGSVHVRENMLEAVVIDSLTPHPKHARSPSLSTSSSDMLPAPKADAQAAPEPPSVLDSGPEIPDLASEKARDLGLLMTIFGDGQDEWGGKESIDEDTDNQGTMSDIAEKDALLEAAVHQSTSEPTRPAAPEKPKQSLKDMFQPHEEEAGFSLLAGLGELDLDLDLDPALDLGAPAPVPISAEPVPSTQAPSLLQGTTTLDSSLLFFFPQPDIPRAKDVFALARVEGWEFGRSGDSETIGKRWEKKKGSLTREWKKRAREAVKARKRRYGGAEGEDM